MDWWLKIELSNLNRKFSKTNNKNSFCQNADSFWHFAKKKSMKPRYEGSLKFIYSEMTSKSWQNLPFLKMCIYFLLLEIYSKIWGPFTECVSMLFSCIERKKYPLKISKKNSFWKKRFDFKLIAKSRVNFMFSV